MRWNRAAPLKRRVIAVSLLLGVASVALAQTVGDTLVWNGSQWAWQAALIAPSRMGSGTADNTTFLRGDQTWQAVSGSAVWGGITGTLGDQADLVAALAAAGGWAYVASTADVSTTSNTVDSTITGLTIPVSASTDYQIRCTLTTSAAASTTGVQITTSGPASPTQINWTHLSQNTATAAIMVSFNAYGIDARTGHDGSDRVMESVYIHLRNGSNAGDVTFAVRSEISGSSVTVFAGSYCEYRSY